MSSFRRDLLGSLPPLHHFSQKPHDQVGEAEQEAEETGEGVELSLGLSLNGRFGVDPRRGKRNLSRASSIPDCLTLSTAEIEFSPPHILRTRSLPAETEEEECRKRKELQSLRRSEAKRKRDQKQRSCSSRERIQGHDGNSVGDDVEGSRCFNGVVHLPPRPLSKQGSAGSQGSGSGSSGVSSESDIRHQFHDTVPRSLAKQNGSIPSNGQVLPAKGGDRTARNALEEMPYVFTKGGGPDGKRVEGFLYRYKKGEEVRIVCVCHGSFLSPAEFVKHAGGGDVEHPMRHIVVLPSSLL